MLLRGLRKGFSISSFTIQLQMQSIPFKINLRFIGPVGYHGFGGQYLRPQTIRRNKILRNTAQLFKRPSRTPGFLNGKCCLGF